MVYLTRTRVLDCVRADDTDQFAENSRRMLNLDLAGPRDIESLQNWIDGNGCIARQESAYLTHSREMVSLAPCRDTALSQVEIWVENKLIQFYRKFRLVRDY
jgi:hypothetical protein